MAASYFKVDLYYGSKRYTSFEYANGLFFALSKAMDKHKKGTPTNHKITRFKPEEILRILHENHSDNTNNATKRPKAKKSPS